MSFTEKLQRITSDASLKAHLQEQKDKTALKEKVLFDKECAAWLNKIETRLIKQAEKGYYKCVLDFSINEIPKLLIQHKDLNNNKHIISHILNIEFTLRDVFGLPITGCKIDTEDIYQTFSKTEKYKIINSVKVYFCWKEELCSSNGPTTHLNE